jgi:hypothetical protein
MLLPAFAQTPVTRAEVLYHQRATRPSSRWRGWLGRTIYVVALTVAMIAFWGQVAGSITRRDTIHMLDVIATPMVVLAIFTELLHIILMLQTATSAVNSISRERLHGTWDILLLTGMDARRIVLGKWWATLRHMSRRLLLLTLLRAGLAVFVGAQSSRIYAHYYSGGQRNGGFMLMPPQLLDIFAVPVLMMVFTFAGAALAASLGVMAAALMRRATAALGTAITIYVLLIVGGVGMVILSYKVVHDAYGDVYLEYPRTAYIILEGMGLSVVDNGTMVLSTLVAYESHYSNNDATPLDLGRVRSAKGYGLAILASLALYPPLISLILGLARRFVVRAGALPAVRWGQGD